MTEILNFQKRQRLVRRLFISTTLLLITLFYVGRYCEGSKKIEEIIHICKEIRLVFSRFFDIRGNLGNAKEKPTRKTGFFREIKRLALLIYLAKLCYAAFLWSQRSFYCNIMRKRCWNRGEYVKSFNNESSGLNSSS